MTSYFCIKNGSGHFFKRDWNEAEPIVIITLWLRLFLRAKWWFSGDHVQKMIMMNCSSTDLLLQLYLSVLNPKFYYRRTDLSIYIGNKEVFVESQRVILLTNFSKYIGDCWKTFVHTFCLSCPKVGGLIFSVRYQKHMLNYEVCACATKLTHVFRGSEQERGGFWWAS